MQTKSKQFKRNSKYFLLLLSTLFFHNFLFGEDFVTNISGKALVCEGEVVTYSVPLTTGSTYNWSAVGGTGFQSIDNTNSLATFTVTWGAMGNPPNSISVQEFSNGVLQGTKSISITISGTPNPQITSDFNSKCGEDTLKGSTGRQDEVPCETVCEYTDVTYTTPQNNGSQYEWSVLGNHNSISGANTNSATVSWAGPGQAYVIVKETNAAGCVDADTVCIEIIDRPDAKFSVDHDGVTLYSSPSASNANVIEICKGSTICFDDLSVGAESWFWDFGNGNNSAQQHPCETFSQSGVYTITQIVENSCHCIDTSYIKVKVSNQEGPEIVCQNVVCGKGTFSYDAILSQSCNQGLFEWNISNNGTIVGSNGLVTNQTPQSITGQNITTIDIDWGSGPNSSISLSVSGCDSLCESATTVNIPIIPGNVNIEGDSIVCAIETQKFKVPCFPGTTYEWKLDGVVQNETSSEFQTQFYAQGNHTISVKYKNDLLSCSGQSANFNVRVLQPFTIRGTKVICEGDTANFKGPYNSSLSWVVKNQNGVAVDSSNGSVLNFATDSTLPAGSYTVIATDDSSPRKYCNKNKYTTLEILAAPPAPTTINGPTEVCVGEATIYSAQPSSSDYLLEWEIDNNGSISTTNGNNVAVSWGSGNKSITLYQISKLKNCRSAAYTIPINDKTPPTVTITGTDTTCGNTDISSPINYQTTAALDGYEWSIVPSQAGSIINGQNTGSIDVIWNDYNGTADIVLTPVVCNNSYTPVNYPVFITTPSMSISGPDTICQSSSGSWVANFDFGNPTNFNWEIEAVDSAIVVANGTGSTATHNFPNRSGSFIVRISATNCLLDYTEIKNIVVLPAPVANLTYSGDIQCIDNNSANLILSTQGASTYSYNWYKNGTPMNPQPSGTTLSIGPNANDAGNYSVNVTDSNGCSAFTNILTAKVCDTLDSCIQINSSANYSYSIAQNSPTPGCNQVSFTSNISPAPNSVAWFWAGSVIATGTSPTVKFPSSGIYPVKMIATFGKDTCTAIYRDTIVVPVISNFEINISCITNDFEVNLINTSDVVIHPLSSFSHQWKIYDINNNNALVSSSTSQDYLDVQNLVGGVDYEITLNETKSYNWGGQSIVANCTHRDTITMPLKTAADFIMSDSILCEGNTLNFTDQSSGNIISWYWDFGDGSSILTQNPGKTYQDTADQFNVNLLVEDEYGCFDSVLKQVDVKANNVDGNITLNSSIPICPGDSVQLTFNNTTSPGSAPYNYLWSNNSDSISTMAYQTSTHYIAVTDKFFCFKNFGPKTVEVINMPSPVINGKSNYCVGDQISLSANYGNNYVYKWYRNMSYQSSFNPTGFNSPSLSQYASVGEHLFKVVISDTVNNCVDSSAIFTVTVNDKPQKPVLSSNPSPACPDSPVTLSVSNPQDYESISWSTGDVATSTVTNVSGVYFADAVDTNGCVSTEHIPVHEMPDFCGFMCGCYSDCIEVGDTFRFPGIEGNFAAWRWERFDGSNWVTVHSGTGTVDDYLVTSSHSETIRLYVKTINGCEDYSCETDLDISICIPKCKGRAWMKDIKCLGTEEDSARYDFNLGMSFSPFGAQCQKYEITVIPPFGSISTNNSPLIVSPGTHGISGTWDLGLAGFSGGEVCFDIIVKNLCDTTSCMMTTCFRVDPCGKPGTDGLNEQVFNENSISFYPNPSNGMIKMNSAIANEYEVSVYSAHGKLVYQKRLDFSMAETKELELNRLDAGIYNIQCFDGKKFISKKVVIQ